MHSAVEFSKYFSESSCKEKLSTNFMFNVNFRDPYSFEVMNIVNSFKQPNCYNVLIFPNLIYYKEAIIGVPVITTLGKYYCPGPGEATGLRLDNQCVGVRDPDELKNFDCPRPPDRPSGPLNLLSNGYRGLLTRG
jgi:hypothetical protein